MAKRATGAEMRDRVERAINLVRAGGTVADLQLKMGLSRSSAREVWARAHAKLGGGTVRGERASRTRSHEYTTCAREIGERYVAGLDDVELQRCYAAVKCLLLSADELLPKIRMLMREQDKRRASRIASSVSSDFSYPSTSESD